MWTSFFQIAITSGHLRRVLRVSLENMKPVWVQQSISIKHLVIFLIETIQFQFAGLKIIEILYKESDQQWHPKQNAFL